MKKTMTVPAASKIDWASRPKALVIRFAFYLADFPYKDEYVTVKIVFKRGLKRHIPIDRNFYEDKVLKVKSVESYEVLEDESSEDYSDCFHLISGKDNSFFGYPSELTIMSSKGCMYFQAIRQVEE